MMIELVEHTSAGGYITGSLTEGCHLILPKGDDRRYCLAQLDDYMQKSRWVFPHQAPVRIQLEAKVSGPDLPGTWGFGLWNDPFSLGLGAGGMSRILPVLPNAAWFFNASPGNYLSLSDGLPGSGFAARTYRSPLLPGIFSLLTLVLFPLAISKWGRKLMRKAARLIVKEDAILLDINVCEWHGYALDWRKEEVTFFVDGMVVLQTPVSPRGKQGFVLWMDNQYFRFDPTGRVEFGFLPIPDEQWLQIRAFDITSG